VQNSRGEKINWAGSLGLRYRLFERRSPLKDPSSFSRAHGFVWTHDNSSVGEIPHLQSEHVATTDTDEKLESYVGLDHQHGSGTAVRFQFKRLRDLPVLHISISRSNASQAYLPLEGMSIENSPLNRFGKYVPEDANLVKRCGSAFLTVFVDARVEVFVDMARKDIARSHMAENLSQMD